MSSVYDLAKQERYRLPSIADIPRATDHQEVPVGFRILDIGAVEQIEPADDA